MSERTLSRDRGSERLARHAGRGAAGLHERRRRSRRRLRILLALLAVTVAGALIWLLWQPYLRISRITVDAGDPSLSTIASSALTGTYFGIVPRNSTFFAPESAMRALILGAEPGIAAVSIYHTGIASLGIRAIARTPVGRWCGASPDSAGQCWLFDGNGFIYAPAPVSATSTASSSVPIEAGEVPLNDFFLYASATPQASLPFPQGATIAEAAALPAAFDFARQLASFGSPVVGVYLHDGEADDTLASGSVVLYLLGQESPAFTALSSARAQFNLSDGSVQYADLRFPGKIYLKAAAKH